MKEGFYIWTTANCKKLCFQLFKAAMLGVYSKEVHLSRKLSLDNKIALF